MIMFATPEKMATLVNAWRHSLSAAATSGWAERKGAGILIMSLSQWRQKGRPRAGREGRPARAPLECRRLVEGRGATGHAIAPRVVGSVGALPLGEQIRRRASRAWPSPG